MRKRKITFAVKRNGVPIKQHGFKSPSKAANITSRNGSIGLFSQYRAFVGCNATIDELWKLRQGEYPKWFVGEIISLYENMILVKAHVDDANYVNPKKKGKN